MNIRCMRPEDIDIVLDINFECNDPPMLDHELLKSLSVDGVMHARVFESKGIVYGFLVYEDIAQNGVEGLRVVASGAIHQQASKSIVQYLMRLATSNRAPFGIELTVDREDYGRARLLTSLGFALTAHGKGPLHFALWPSNFCEGSCI